MLRTPLLTIAVGLSLFASAARAQVISAWHFDEASGTTAADAVGTINGSLAAGANFAAGGINGNAVNITTGLVDMGNNFAFGGGTTFSIVTWFKLNTDDTNGYIVSGRHQATQMSGYFHSVNNAGSGSGEVTGGSTFYQGYPNPVSTNLNLNDGNWHQLVGVHDVANSEARLYVDGVLRDTELANIVNGPSSANFAVGGILNPAGNQMVNAYQGMTDEVSLWSNALTGPEVLYLFNNPGALVVPEPTGLTLLGAAVVGAAIRRRRRAVAAN